VVHHLKIKIDRKCLLIYANLLKLRYSIMDQHRTFCRGRAIAKTIMLLCYCVIMSLATFVFLLEM